MKKLVAKLLIGVLCLGMIPIGKVEASDDQKALGDIGITAETSSEVMAYSTLKGVYLLGGTASIVQRGTGLVGAGGDTAARQVVDYISLGVNVQYYENGGWHTYTGWTVAKYNDDYIGSSKLLSVPRGRYYCTRTVHAAGGEVLANASNGIWIG